MIKAIKNLISRRKVQNLVHVPDELLQLIHQDLGLLDKHYDRMGERLWKYVIDGADKSVILALAGLDKAADALLMRTQVGYFGSSPKTSAARREIFSRIDALPPVVAYRLAAVYHIAWSARQTKQRRWPHLASDLEWLEVFISEGLSMGPGNHLGKHKTSWSAQTFVNILNAGGHPSEALARLILLDEPRYGYAYFEQRAFDTIDGLGAYFSDHPGIVKEALSHPKAAHRAHVLEFLKKKKTALTGEVVPVVCELAIGSAKTVCAAAEGLLLNQSADTRETTTALLREKLQNGPASERVHAVGLLARLEGDACLDLLKARLETEKSKKVVAELEKYLMIKSESPETAAGAYEDGLIAPQPKAFETEFTMTTELEKDLLEIVEKYNAEAMEAHTLRWDRTDQRWRRGSRTIKPPLSADAATFICKGLQSPEQVKARKQPGGNLPDAHLLWARLGEFIKGRALSLVPMIRLGFFFGLILSDDQKRYNPHHIQEDMVEWLARHKAEKDPALSLIDLAAAFTAAGLSEAWPAKLYLDVGYRSRRNPLNLADDEIWPLFHVHPVFLEDALGLSNKILTVRDFWKTEFRMRAFQILATFPKPPRRFATLLWEQALGTGKTERPLAQACLVNYPGREKLIITALDDGRKDIRTAAARWLGELKVDEAQTPVRKALAKEKHDAPKAQMMETLEILGVDIDRFLNRKKLQEEAEKGLKQALPKDLAWFPLDRLPQVHWGKNRQTVAPEIIRWFVVQAHKLKNPEPGPLQRRYFKLMRPDERAKLGEFVLSAWLAQDTIPRYTHEEASNLADRDLARMLPYVKQHPQYYPNFDEQLYRISVLNHYLNECLGSATPSKGILAVSAACCGSEIVAPVQRYLKQWYGRRMAQCKALIRMLSWVDHPLAIQLILATATRFRTKGIQKEAALCAQLIAERKGWTLTEMADRTIPTAGFDIDGRQEIDYGVRKFTARLLGDFSIQLENEKGKVIKNLPPANKAENEDEVKAIKKEFSSAKKEIKQVLNLQKERLYEAMCTQRTWRFEDWDMYLNHHPIVSRYCRKLVWMALAPGQTAGNAPRGQNPASAPKILHTFRSTSDRALTDVNDEPVALEADHRVQMAHQSFLSAEDGRRWREHLADYEIEPLFEQFRESDFKLTEKCLEQRAIKDYEGYLINSFKLRSLMTRLGYTRGAAEDGGWFYTYHKNFPGLKRQAVIEFTGNVLPEENRAVGLMRLYFITTHQDQQDDYAYGHRPLKLSDMPAVMVMECANDLKRLADEGSGYDEAWRKKTEY